MSNNNNNKYIYNIYKNKNFTPIWLMRQAGRYLPEYLKIRKNKQNFLELCYDAKLASEITLQPIKRFNFDAAIIFSDILVILDALGAKVRFAKNHGPIIETNIDEFIETNNNSSIIKTKINNKLAPIYEAIRITRKKLPEKTSLIGFAGAFWTLFAYLIEGEGSKTFYQAKSFYLNNPQKFTKIKDILCEAISIHLQNQIDAGCDTIQLFDSWVSVLSPYHIDNLVIEPTKEIVKQVKNNQAKIICFPRGISSYYDKFAKEIDFDIFALDYNTPIELAVKIYDNYGKAIQGNLDPTILLANDYQILSREVKHILSSTKNIPAIFNLGHGILPSTPIKNVENLMKIIREY